MSGHIDQRLWTPNLTKQAFGGGYGASMSWATDTITPPPTTNKWSSVAITNPTPAAIWVNLIPAPPIPIVPNGTTAFTNIIGFEGYSFIVPPGGYVVSWLLSSGIGLATLVYPTFDNINNPISGRALGSVIVTFYEDYQPPVGIQGSQVFLGVSYPRIVQPRQKTYAGNGTVNASQTLDTARYFGDSLLTGAITTLLLRSINMSMSTRGGASAGNVVDAELQVTDDLGIGGQLAGPLVLASCRSSACANQGDSNTSTLVYDGDPYAVPSSLPLIQPSAAATPNNVIGTVGVVGVTSFILFWTIDMLYYAVDTWFRVR
jgi:hypothetical protein